MMNEEQVKELCNEVRQTAFELHSYLRHGHLEKVYENGLANRLSKNGISVQKQAPLQVKDEDGTILGDFYADLLVENQLIIELKACKGLIDEHVAQVLGYLRASNIKHGMLINFGAPKIEINKYASSAKSVGKLRFREIAHCMK